MSWLDRTNKAHKQRVRVLSKQFLETAFTAAATSEVVDLGTVPAGSYVLGCRVKVATAFTGGGTTDAKVAIGDANDDDAILASADVDVAVDGEASSHTLGVAPHKTYAAATTLKVKLTSTGANVVAFTAGDMTVEVLYAQASL
jgi:hypothetical protein